MVDAGVQAGTISEAEYRPMQGLSFSAMKHLAVSPLRYWYMEVNPQRPIKESTMEQNIGSAIHCADLEPDKFDSRYARAIDPADYPGCLKTIDDLRKWLTSHGLTPKGMVKAGLIDQVQKADAKVPILDVLYAYHAAEHANKVIFGVEEWKRVQGAASALLAEPRIQALLADGQPEIPMFATDPDSGVALKARMDFVTPKLIFDLKSFTQQRGRTIDESVTKAIWWEKYYQQGVFYSFIRALCEKREHPWTNGEFAFAFVESEEPHETRIRVMRPKVGGEVSLLWERGRAEMRALIHRYAECLTHFGIDRPWRYACEVDPLVDQEFPGVVWY